MKDTKLTKTEQSYHTITIRCSRLRGDVYKALEKEADDSGMTVAQLATTVLTKYALRKGTKTQEGA